MYPQTALSLFFVFKPAFERLRYEKVWRALQLLNKPVHTVDNIRVVEAAVLQIGEIECEVVEVIGLHKRAQYTRSIFKVPIAVKYGNFEVLLQLLIQCIL